MLAAIVLLAVATIACDNKEAVEYNLQGTWHTTGLTGRNGAGKSTMLKMLAGLQQPSEEKYHR